MGLMLLTPRTASAQASAGITGTITDTSGAVISAAHVTITNDDTAVVNRAVTSSSGTYVLRTCLKTSEGTPEGICGASLYV
jgi:hypothetical protein